MNKNICIAISKGRVLEAIQPVLARAGLMTIENLSKSRKLVLDSEHADIKIVIVRGVDVPTYVAHGATELGIVGKDMILEYENGGIYEVLDFNVACCSLIVAKMKNMKSTHGRTRVATKYVNTTKKYFATKGEQVEIIKLYGSMELSPLVGLSDLIVDLVDTGKTLAANGLVINAEIAKISARLIVNKAALKMDYKRIELVMNLLKSTLNNPV